MRLVCDQDRTIEEERMVDCCQACQALAIARVGLQIELEAGQASLDKTC